MNSSRTFLVRASAFIAISVSATAATAGAQRGADTTTRIVDRAFEAWRNTDSPGCAVGISRNGRVVYERGYGMANLETGTPITPASIFHVASISKQFTAMAIMLLANDGKLSIDDNIRKYLPEIRDYGTPITIRHLLTHTSGLRDQWELLALARGRFEEDRITEPDVMDIVPRQTAPNFTPAMCSNSATALVFSQCFCMRSGSVSMPVRIRNALNGDSAGPRSRRSSTRHAIAKAKLPKVSWILIP